MIAKANTHNSGSRLASYLTQQRDGQRAEVWQLRGFEASHIKDAFRDIDIMADGTRCEQPLFHAQIRLPDGERITKAQWERAADLIEETLGFQGQPRAIVFHSYIDTGDVHMHVAWSRIDQETFKARPVPFFKLALKEVTRNLEQELGLTPVQKERQGAIRYAPTKAEDEQARRLGTNVNAIRNAIRACWDRSNCGRDFDNSLAEEGLILAKGDRAPFVVLDHAGGIHAIGQRILDKPAAFIHQRLSDLDRQHMPGIEQARELMLNIPHNRLSRLHLELAEVDRLISLHGLKREAAETDRILSQPRNKALESVRLNAKDMEADKPDYSLPYGKGRAKSKISFSRAANGIGNSLGKPLEAVGAAIESLFAPPMTPQRQAEADIAKQERQADADVENEHRERRGRGR